MKKIALIVFLLIVCAVSGFFYWRSGHDVRPVVQLQTGPIVQAVYASGTVEPSVLIPIAPRMNGRLMTLMADEGLSVKKDTVLAQLEDTDLLKNLEGLKAQALVAERELARRQDLMKRKATSALELDRAQADRDAAVAAVSEAEAQLSYLKLVAPEDGLIIRRDGEIGTVIPMGQPVFWMSCCAPLRVSAEVDEEDISLVAPGQKVVISADAFPGQVFEGIVQSITPKGDPIARSYRVRLTLPEQTPLMIGMTTEANIITREDKNALLAPVSAIRDNKVWLVEGDTVRVVPVTTGTRSREAIQITDGLSKDSTILLNADETLADGTKVRTRLEKWQAF